MNGELGGKEAAETGLPHRVVAYHSYSAFQPEISKCSTRGETEALGD